MGKFVKKFETALLLALCLTLAVAFTAEAQAGEIRAGVIRLHVIASGNSPREQQLKMRAASAVERRLESALSGCRSAAEARERVERALPELRALADSLSGGEGAAVTFGTAHYPTRSCAECTLPAGRYLSLRVAIGGGGGRNWWGVIFPELDAVSGAEAEETMGGAMRVIYGGEKKYRLKFRILELIDEARESLCKMFD